MVADPEAIEGEAVTTGAFNLASDAAGIAGLIYSVVVGVATGVALLSRDEKRRKDARKTLELLMRRRGE